MDEIFQNIYKNKKVLITGHTGFKGSWLALWLHSLGAEVTGYALEPNTNPNLFNILNLQDKITHNIGDIRDGENLKRIFLKYQPEIVFHLAAQPLVRASYKDPKLTYETNIMGTVNLFEAVRETSAVRVVINVTSDKCYENREYDYNYKETDPMGGFDPYSSSKGVAELITSAYRNSFFHPGNFGETHHVALASARAGNVIGGGDWSEDRLIPDCIKSFAKKEDIILRNPEAIRPWQHVLEPLYGYLMLANRMLSDGIAYSQGWNFGPDNTLSVIEVVNKLTAFWNNDASKVAIIPDKMFHEAKLLKLDTSKAKTLLNWFPVYNTEESVIKTALWYKNYYENNVDMADYSLNEIEDYTKKGSVTINI